MTQPDPTPMPTPTAPQPPRPTPGRIDVYATEYRCQAIRRDDGRHTLVGKAIRTLWGWHVIVPVPRGEPLRWRTAPTAYDAAQELYALAGAR